MRRTEDRRRSARWPDLDGSAGHHRVWRSVIGQLRAQQMPLRAGVAHGLIDGALGGRTGTRRHPVHMTLPQTEQHERQQNEKAQQDRASSSRIVQRRLVHPWAAQT